MKNTIDKLNIKKIFPWIWLTVGYAINACYHLIFGKQMLDSDMSAEMILANLLNTEGSILSKNWLYSTELRVFQMQWFYRLGLLLFPDNWHLARTFSMLLAIAIFASIVYLLFRKIDLKEYAPWAAAIVIFPIGSWYLWQTLYGGYYLTYILLAFIVLLLNVSYANASSFKKYVYFALTCLIGFCSGLNGVKQLMVFWAPLCIAALWNTLYKLHVSQDKKISFHHINDISPYLLITIISTCFNLIGYIVNSRVLADAYSFQSFNDIKISELGNPLDQLTLFIKSFGFSPNLQLLTPRGISSVLGILVGLLVLLSAFRLLKHFKAMSSGERFIFSVCFSVISFCIFVFWVLDSQIQYYQSVIPFGLILLILEIKNEKITISCIRTGLLNIALMIAFIVSLGTIRNEMVEPLHPQKNAPEISSAVEWLRENEYDKGVSRFWLSPLITELSDGTIEMWTLTEEEDSWYQWLQKKDHLESEPNGKYFYIYFLGFPSPYLDAHPELELVYEDSICRIYANR